MKQNEIERSFRVREQENVKSKTEVAHAAPGLIPERSSIIIATGRTMLQLAKLLSLRSGHKLFTDSLPVASALIRSSNQIFLFGGGGGDLRDHRDQSLSVPGGWTASQVRQIQADLCFIGTDGFGSFDGHTSSSSSDAFVDREILAHDDKRYVLADYTKFKRKSLYKICDWDGIDALITNREAEGARVKKLLEHTKCPSLILTECRKGFERQILDAALPKQTGHPTPEDGHRLVYRSSPQTRSMESKDRHESNEEST